MERHIAEAVPGGRAFGVRRMAPALGKCAWRRDTGSEPSATASAEQ
ncbi:MAG TPA: hypothetical protein VJM69_04955 [Dehalococcoidia bacterium]|nr:hypothetical protein [Dehalococcoidia bacterium]